MSQLKVKKRRRVFFTELLPGKEKSSRNNTVLPETDWITV